MKIITTILVLLFSFKGFSQLTGKAFLSSEKPVTAFYYNPNTSNLIQKNTSEGTSRDRYLYANFIPGTVKKLGMTAQSVDAFLRYDMLSGFIEMSFHPDGSNAFLLSQARNIEIVMDLHTFRFIDYNLNGKEFNGYVEVLDSFTDGDIVGLVHTVVIEHNKESKLSGYNVLRQVAYIDNYGIATSFDNSSKNVLKHVPDVYQETMYDFIKSKKIKFEDDYKGVIAVVKYYASIK